jgi:GDSL-like Lipase/Acylhydrolase family
MTEATPTGRHRAWTAAAAAAASLVAVGAAVAIREPPAPPDGLVILYGDSLSAEASGAFIDELAATTEAEVVNRAVPGDSPCDALPTMREDVALEPTVVVIQFVGNNHTPCSRGPGGARLTGEALAERTAADVAAATEMFAAAGARVVLVGGPDGPGLPGAASREIADAYNEIVNEWAGRDLGRVRYADAAATVTGPDHRFVERLPCRDDEGADDGCEGGEVTVRSPDRIHFCPVLHAGLGCPVPSPGARRFGREMARVATMALDPEG